jgi:hypothetical protein
MGAFVIFCILFVFIYFSDRSCYFSDFSFILFSGMLEVSLRY